jgi:hypothetical protein
MRLPSSSVTKDCVEKVIAGGRRNAPIAQWLPLSVFLDVADGLGQDAAYSLGIAWAFCEITSHRPDTS